MKRILICILGLAVLFCFTACGSEEYQDVDYFEENEVEVDTNTGEGDTGEGDTGEVSVNDFSSEVEALTPMLINNFAGHSPELTDPYGGVSFNEDSTHAVFVLFNGTTYYSFQGDCWIDEDTGLYVIDDPNEEFLLTFALTEGSDGVYTLDGGDIGSISVVSTTVDGMKSLLKLFFVSEAIA